MLDELIRDLESIVRETYPHAQRLKVATSLHRSDLDGEMTVENVHVIFYVDDEMKSYSMWWLKDFRNALREQIRPEFDPILLGA